jgi:hypothetical protein
MGCCVSVSVPVLTLGLVTTDQVVSLIRRREITTATPSTVIQNVPTLIFMSQSHSLKSNNEGKATTTARTSMTEEDPWQTAAQVAASRTQQQNSSDEPATWSERPPWLSSKPSSLQQQPSNWNPNDLSQPPSSRHVRDDDTAWTRRIVQGWHILDGVAGLLWLLYALLLCRARHHHRQDNDSLWKFSTGWLIIMVMTWYVAAVLLLRTCCGGVAMTLDWWDRCGLRWSFITSIILGLTWLISSVYGFFGKKRFLNWLEQHYHTLLWSTDVWHVIQHTSVLLWIFPLVACLIELIRFYMVHRYYLQLQERDDILSNPVNRPRRTRRPWWWQSNSAVMENNNNNASYMDPLLSDETQHRNNTAGAAKKGWFGGFFGGSSNSGGGRDDASVEYASISEDWVSRSEEDPLWWSRDEEMTTPKRPFTSG